MTLRLALIAVLMAWWPAHADLGPEGVEGLPVTRVEIRNGSRVRDSEIRALFALRPGDVYTPARCKRSIELLAQKAEIRNVVVRGNRDGEGLALRVEVSSEPLVRSVDFEGNSAVANSRLAARVRTRVDRPAREALLSRDARSIEELYRSQGFPAAQAAPRVERSPDGYWCYVTFQIQEGEPRRIARIELEGEWPEDRAGLLSALGLRVGDPASSSELREGTQRVAESLWQTGYVEARVTKARYSDQDAELVLVLPLTAGEPVDILLAGIDEWSGRPLRAIARSHFGEPVTQEWADRLADLMAEDLRSEGYLSAEVIGELGRAFGRRYVVFRVERGPRAHVAEVEFQGNESLPAGRLRGYMSLVVGGLLRPPPFTPDALDRDLRALAAVYSSSGYLDAQVILGQKEVSPSGRVRLMIRVDEGPQYRVGEVRFAASDSITPEEAEQISAIRSRAVADPEAIDRARLRLTEELQRRGYPDAQVTCREKKDPVRAVVDLTFEWNASTPVRFGRVVVSGNARTDTAVVLRELAFREGELWNAQKVVESRQQLYRLGLFQSVRIEPFLTSAPDGARDVKVEIEEQDAGSVTLGLGYATEEQFKLSAAIAYQNLQGYGRSIELRGGYDSIDQSLALNFREPWLLGEKLDLRLSLLRLREERPAFNLSTTGFQASLDREIAKRIKGSLLYTLEANRLSGVPDESVLSRIDQGTHLVSAIGPVLAWDSRDDPFNPRRGYQHTFQAEWALDALGSEAKYQKYLGTVSGYFTARGLTLALLARGGIAISLLDTADLPVNKRFFLGGRTTVRGFNRDEIGPKAEDGTPVGGDAMLNVKSELRFPLWKQLGGAFFWDAGNVWNRNPSLEKVDTSGNSGMRHAGGFGLRYNTPVGPLSLDFGFKLDRREGESLYVWHFTAGNVF